MAGQERKRIRAEEVKRRDRERESKRREEKKEKMRKRKRKRREKLILFPHAFSFWGKMFGPWLIGSTVIQFPQPVGNAGRV
jgi:hypothetical protein